MKKTITVLLIVAMAAIGWFMAKDHLSARKKAPARCRTTQIERRDVIQTVSATGALSAVVTVAVGTEVSGQIKELLVDFNTPVKAGQVIARIDPESYETLLRQAQAELAASQAKLQTQKMEILRYEAELANARENGSAARAQTIKARASLEYARRNKERQEMLMAQDFIAKNDYDAVQTAYEETKAQLEQAEAQERAAASKVSYAQAGLAVAKAQIKEAEATVELRQAALDKRKVDLNNTIITSPVDGVVIDRSVDVGQTVAASLQAPTLFTIAQDLSQMEVSTYVDEADIGRIKEGQAAQFSVDAFGSRQFTGHVRQVRKMGKTVQNVVTYEVIIAAENHDLSLMPGMTADVQIELLKKNQVLAVANAALRFTPPGIKAAEGGAPQGTVAGGFANSSDAAAGFDPVEERSDPRDRIRRLAGHLELTEAQRDELRTIFKQVGAELMTARKNGETYPGAAAALRAKLRKETRAAIMRLLDARQLQLYENMIAEGAPKRGTLWRLDASGRPEAIPVFLGTSDMAYTEIYGPGIEEGLEVIAGAQ